MEISENSHDTKRRCEKFGETAKKNEVELETRSLNNRSASSTHIISY